MGGQGGRRREMNGFAEYLLAYGTGLLAPCLLVLSFITLLCCGPCGVGILVSAAMCKVGRREGRRTVGCTFAVGALQSNLIASKPPSIG